MCPPGTEECNGGVIPQSVDVVLLVHDSATLSAEQQQALKESIAFATSLSPAHVTIDGVSSEDGTATVTLTVVTPDNNAEATAAAIGSAAASGQIAAGAGMASVEASSVTANTGTGAAAAGGMSSGNIALVAGLAVAGLAVVAVVAVVVLRRRSTGTSVERIVSPGSDVAPVRLHSSRSASQRAWE